MGNHRCQFIRIRVAALCVALCAVLAPAVPADAGTPRDGFGLGNGSDGSFTAAGAGEVVNEYSALAADALAGETAVTVADGTRFAVDDLILVWQAQAGSYPVGDATPIDLAASNAGHYELVRITGIAGDVLAFAPALIGTYAVTDARAQVVRVPEYEDVTVPAGTSIQAVPWDGATGGVVVFLARGTVTVDGAIDASGQGFRGGARGVGPIVFTPLDVPDDPDCTSVVGHRGEGVDATAGAGPAGCGTAIRGNGGAAGAQLNAGGGGGGHHGKGSKGANTVNLNTGTHRPFGGQGGASLLGALDARLSMGGGGGGGQADQGVGTAGARGGGAIVFRAGSLAGAGFVRANGATAANGRSDGAGGGGAGGAILVNLVAEAVCGGMSADGGRGGDVGGLAIDVGAGGGGGGGRVWLGGTDTSGCAATAAGGLRGAGGIFPPGEGDGRDGEVRRMAALHCDADGDGCSDCLDDVLSDGADADGDGICDLSELPDAYVMGDGSDGDLVLAGDQVINDYGALRQAALAGATEVVLDAGHGAGFGADDLVLIWQVQGGVYASGDAANVDLSADTVGSYELARVTAVSGDTLSLDHALANTYEVTDATAQVVRVPEYGDVTVPAGASITALPWDGARGGIVAFLAQGTVTVDGVIEVSAQGFRGGQAVDATATTPSDALDDPGCTAGLGRRGEGLDARPDAIGPATGCGIGNRAHAGGGGGQHNAGGGGGGHYGQGGQGGLDVSGPSAFGGLGGARLRGALTERLALGGGGGAGQMNDGQGSSGAGGGGVIWFRAVQLAGSGRVRADGGAALDGNADGSGGGGGGGAIFAHLVGDAVCGSMSAHGGPGGDQLDPLYGPGGGGGGGRIWLGATDASGCPGAAAGGAAGTGGTGFPPYQGPGQEGEVLRLHAMTCDLDGDLCDEDCQVLDVANDGLDTDDDLACNASDPDDDNDGVADDGDSAVLDPTICGIDGDGDTCDDCAVTGADQSGGDPANDGLDTDGDGACNVSDGDDDNDGVPDDLDPQPQNANVCGVDGDGDTCDDCALTGADQSGGDPANDGADDDNDGICNRREITYGGCAASGHAPGPGIGLLILLVWVVSARRRPRSVRAIRRAGAVAVLLVLVVSAAPAQAQVQIRQDIPVDGMRLAVDRDGIFAVEWADLADPMSWDMGLWLGAASDLVEVRRYTDDMRLGAPLAHRFSGHLSGALVVLRGLQLGVDVPVVLSQRGDAIPNTMAAGLSGAGLGDARLLAKWQLLRARDHGLHLALTPALTVPTGCNCRYLGEDGLTFAPGLALSRERGALRVSSNLGYRMRANVTVPGGGGDLDIGDELFARVGAGYRRAGPWARPLELDVTIAARAAPGDAARSSHIEALAGATYDVRRDLQVLVAGGLGTGNGVGTPDWRVLAGVRMSRHRRDQDRDGILDGVDACPAAAEDADGFQDHDGCAELDNDGDGVVDSEDAAPDQPEDVDGFQDADGAPDPDNDQDGVADGLDRCPLAPETPNGWEDGDGCPDEVPDSDGDGVDDLQDACRERAEDGDGFADEDGCPDADNDQDGVADALDRCPDQSGPGENGGCPDTDRDNDTVVDRLDNCPDKAGTPEEQGCVERQWVAITGARVEMLETLQFRGGGNALSRDARALIAQVANVLAAHPEIALVQVQGHTDDRGSADLNLALSQRRAEAVVDYLVELGIDRARLEAKGFGEARPVADNARPAGRRKNRRVEFVIVQGGGDVLDTSHDD